jgi:hypothetical protein
MTISYIFILCTNLQHNDAMLENLVQDVVRFLQYLHAEILSITTEAAHLQLNNKLGTKGHALVDKGLIMEDKKGTVPRVLITDVFG